MSKQRASGAGRQSGRESAEIRRLRARVAELESRVDGFRVLADQSASLIFLYDLEARRFVYANQRFEELLGCSLAALTAPGFDFFTLIAPDSLEKVRASHAMHLRGEEHLPFEFGMLTRDGRRLGVLMSSWITSYGGHPAVVGIISDLSAQQRLAEELQGAVRRADTERALADSVIAALGEGIIVQDRGYRITYQNEVNRRLFGDRVGELCHRVYGGLERICPGCPVERTFRDGQVHRHMTQVSVDGRARHYELVSSPLRDAAGKVVAGLKLVREVTEQVEAAAALRAAKEELERQNVELRTLDRIKDGLLRDVSHELKTPVAKQAMQLELLRVQLGGACDGQIGRTIAVMEEAVHRQQRVIRNLLDLARLEGGQRAFHLGPVRLDRVLARVLEDYAPTLQAAGFTVAVDAGPVTATADEEMLWHVFSNLVNNAVKFAAREGERRLEVSAGREGDQAVVRLADNGLGLGPEELARAFERFYQASASIEGSGVGLNICRAIMEGMGGGVVLESPGPGRGAVATVRVPL